jgi:hypothetical protein
MQSFLHHGCNKRGGSLWRLMDGHRCNVLDQEPKDGGGLVCNVKEKTFESKQKHERIRQAYNQVFALGPI